MSGETYERACTGERGNGVPLWRHSCGHVEAFDVSELAEIGGGCDACESGSDDPAEWQPLYLRRPKVVDVPLPEETP